MTRTSRSVSDNDAVGGQHRRGPTLAAFVIGLPLSVGLLWLGHYGPLQGTEAERYLSHPIEVVEIIMFACSIGAFVGKLFALLSERAALRRRPVPQWDGKAVPVEEATRYLAQLEGQPRWFASTWLGRRVRSILQFVQMRNSASDLDDHLRALADTDAANLESSYSLTRFITWAIPILGFLGTVLGITGAVAGISPEELEKGINRVTDGLAIAFDTTALALALTMIVMFISFLVERAEERTLGDVDQYVDRELAHRFERTGAAGSELAALLRQQQKVFGETVEMLVEKQAAVWARALEAAEVRRTQLESDFRQQLTTALETALEKTLQVHDRRLAELEKQAVGPATVLIERLSTLARLAEQLAKQTEALARLQEGEERLIRLQQVIQQNLAVLADAGSFQQAVHSLTAAIHLLTAHAVTGPPGSGRRPGAAA